MPRQSPRPPAPAAPAVVAVVVTCDPGYWLEEALEGLARQDYPNLSVLVVDAASSEDPTERVARALPGAFVCRLERRVGFGSAVNQATKLIEGASHLLACHDDVALAPDSVRLLVEESFRQNAGIATPKFVRWDDPDRLIAVGAGCDRGGVVVDLVDVGELDQQQHDVVREVFIAPSGATLIRADLLEALGGFDEQVDCFGEDLDLCWRARLAGARIVAVPAARARHLEATRSGQRQGWTSATSRRRARRLAEAHRCRILMTCYRWFELAWILPLVLLWGLVEAASLVVVGRGGEAWDGLAALGSGFSRPRDLLGARRRAQASRVVGDKSIRGAQAKGNARLRALTRGLLREVREEAEQHRGVPGVGALEGAWSADAAPGPGLLGEEDDRLDGVEAGAAAARSDRSRKAAAALWAGLLLVLVLGSRSLLGHELPQIAQIPTTSLGWGGLWRSWWSAWQQSGLGAGTVASPALALLGLLDTVVFGAAGTLQHVVVLGPLLIGPIGAYRAARWWGIPGTQGSRRARLVALVAYAVVPIPYDALAAGRWSGLVAYAAAPWMLSFIARLSAEAPHPLTTTAQARGRVIGLGVLAAVVASVAPSFIYVVAVTGLALLGGSALAGRPSSGARMAGVGVAGAAVATVLLLPWSAQVLGSGVATFGASAGAAGAMGFGQVLRMATGPFGQSWAGWAMLVVAALPLVIGTGWRLAWAVRMWSVALVFFWWTWAGSRGWLPALPPELALAPAAAALAASAALGAVAFELDLPSYRFGWRQVAAAVSAAALVVAAVPVLAASAGGRWRQPSSGAASVLAFLPAPSQVGNYRVMWVGAPEALPLASRQLQAGVAYAASYNGMPGAADLWETARQGATPLIGTDLRLVEAGMTTQLGHLIAPMAVRYIVVPSSTAPSGAGGENEPPPTALLQGLTEQTDLQLLDVDPNYTVYENAAWAPARAVLPAGALSASTASGPAALGELQQTSLAGATPVLTAGRGSGSSGLAAGTEVFDSATHDRSWHLIAGGASSSPRPAFGWAMTFTVPGAAGTAEAARLAYEPPVTTRLLQLLQILLWAAAAAAVFIDVRRRRRRGPDSEPVLSEWFEAAGSTLDA